MKNNTNIACIETNEFYTIFQLKLRHNAIINYGYLIHCKEEHTAVVIDPGWDYDTIKFLLNFLGVSISKVVLTHGHFDHVNLIGEILKECAIEIYLHPDDLSLHQFPENGITFINDNYSIKSGMLNLKCIHTPGHTRGSCCFLTGNILFSGDTLFSEGVGICIDYPAAELLFNSVQKIKKILSPNDRIFPGHSFGLSPGMSFQDVLNSNIYLSIDKCEAFCSFRMRKTQKRSELFNFH